MIGSHNSYSYLNPTESVYNSVSGLWRCQTKTIQEQYNAGVRYFDVRVRKDGNFWRVCHGIVDFTLKFPSLENICLLFQNMEGAKLRLILESGEVCDFETNIKSLSKKYSCLVFSCIKDGWRVIIDKGNTIIDYTYTPWLTGESFWHNIKRFNFFSSIKSWAAKHNPSLMPEMLTSDEVHFMDYV